MTFMWRRYSPKTNRFSLARIFTNHLPLEGSSWATRRRTRALGQDAHEADDVGSHLLVRETSRDISLTISRPWQIMISASKGSLRANSARSCARLTGRRMTKVPAAPMLTASRCFSCSASVVGRKVCDRRR